MILVALGANLPGRHGSPHETLTAAHEALMSRKIRIMTSSRTWLTAPVPVSDQPWYHNQVVQVETEQSPFALLETLQDIEREFGRAHTIRNAPRILDLDLITYHQEILEHPELTVPHPRMHARAFVLLPLQDIAPGWIHPVLKKPLSALLADLPGEQEAKPMEP